MDLGYLLSSLLSQALRVLSLRISFTFLGSYFSFSLLAVLIGTLILSLSVCLVLKFINR